MNKSKLKNRLSDLEKSIRVTDAIMMLVAKETGMTQERFKELVERGSLVAMQADLDGVIQGHLQYLPPEVREEIEVAIKAVHNGGSLESAKAVVDEAFRKMRGGDDHVQH